MARYFARVLHSDQAPIRAARFTQSGTLRTSPSRSRWMPFEATQHVSPRDLRFDWDARIAAAPLVQVRVRESLLEGRGGGRADLWSAIKLHAEADTPPLNAGALHRYLAEAVWYPTALWPSEQLAWSPIDERKALATLTSHGTTVSLEFHFNREGEVAAIYAPERWARSGKKYVPMPWEGHFFGYWECSGILIPSAGEVGWYVNGAWQAVWKGRVTFASYELEAPWEDVPHHDKSKWRERLRQTQSASLVLREMAAAYGVGKHDLGLMLVHIWKDAETADVQNVWHWDFDRKGKGLPDAEIDQRLSKLIS